MHTEPALESIPAASLDAVTGGTLGPEPGTRDPGNDNPCDRYSEPFVSGVCNLVRELKPNP